VGSPAINEALCLWVFNALLPGVDLSSRAGVRAYIERQRAFRRAARAFASKFGAIALGSSYSPELRTRMTTESKMVLNDWDGTQGGLAYKFWEVYTWAAVKEAVAFGLDPRANGVLPRRTANERGQRGARPPLPYRERPLYRVRLRGIPGGDGRHLAGLLCARRRAGLDIASSGTIARLFSLLGAHEVRVWPPRQFPG
jgi:hypothetical protein